MMIKKLSMIALCVAAFATCALAFAQGKPEPVIKIVRPATPPSFHLPIDCKPGKDCWVLNYPDVGPEKDGKGIDTACLSRTYDGHKGTDIAIRDEATMKKGVDVLAAADGTVARVRDGEPDRFPTPGELETTKKNRRECGNAVLIDHGDRWGGKWQTMYCHMKQGSIAVKAGQAVKAGDKIGQVGLSGMTQFPHIHFGVIHEAKVIDPFTGANLLDGCSEKKIPLWDKKTDISYQPLVFFSVGFDTAPPSLETLDRERIEQERLPKDIPALVFHAEILGVRQGDDVDVVIESPDGKTFAQSHVVQEKTRARQMYYVGRKINESTGFEPGSYTGKITINRKSEDGTEQPFEDRRSINVE